MLPRPYILYRRTELIEVKMQSKSDEIPEYSVSNINEIKLISKQLQSSGLNI